MKLAVLICGETRTWSSAEVEKNSLVPSLYPTVSHGWEYFYHAARNCTDAHVDFYGLTWSHCEPPKNTRIFNDIKFIDFNGSEYRTDIIKKCESIFKNMSLPGVEDSEYFWNSIAQYYQWISGFKFVFAHHDYDFVFKTRWDIVPDEAAFQSLIEKLKSVQYTKNNFLGVQEMSLIEHPGNDREVHFMDMNFVINKHLYNLAFSKNPTDEILYDHIVSSKPGEFGKYHLFFPKNQSHTSRHIEAMIGTHLFSRVRHKGFNNYYFQDDFRKNLSNTVRPPT